MVKTTTTRSHDPELPRERTHLGDASARCRWGCARQPGDIQYYSSGGGGSAGEFFETFLNNVSEGIYEVQVGKGGWMGGKRILVGIAKPVRVH
jgi:hypothetical protein